MQEKKKMSKISRRRIYRRLIPLLKNTKDFQGSETPLRDTIVVDACHYLLWLFGCSVVSDSLWPSRLQPTRLLCPWNFPGRNTGVGCYFLLQESVSTHGPNPRLLRLLHWQADSLLLSRLESCYTFVEIQRTHSIRLSSYANFGCGW